MREITNMSNKIIIEYPDNLPDLLQESPEEFERKAKMVMAIKLFELKRISSGIAAEMVGMERVSFLLELRKYDVEMINMEPEELASDLENT
jgi:predicted HTH domain antitoxin